MQQRQDRAQRCSSAAAAVCLLVQDAAAEGGSSLSTCQSTGSRVDCHAGGSPQALTATAQGSHDSGRCKCHQHQHAAVTTRIQQLAREAALAGVQEAEQKPSLLSCSFMSDASSKCADTLDVPDSSSDVSESIADRPHSYEQHQAVTRAATRPMQDSIR